MNLRWRLVAYWWALLCALVWSPAWAKEPLTVGVLAFRNEANTTAQWKPLEAYLNRAVPEYVFTVKALDLTHLREAVRQARVDLVITQPAEYVRMTHESGLSSPLATLLNSYAGKSVRVLGGTIVTRADQSQINEVADLKDKSVAVLSKESFAGYQVQAYALKNAKVSVGTVVELGESQDAALQSVLEGQADVAFVRSGLIESLMQEGRLDGSKIKVVNRQNFPGYPFAVSTALYPEWPVVALQHVRDDTAARVAGSLLSLPHNGSVAQQIGVAGFSVPSDYESVRSVMRTMKLPPFNLDPGISLMDVWREYWVLIVMGFMLTLTVTLLAAKSTLLSRRFRDLNETLETRISERTSELASRNADLAQTLHELNQTRDELIESEKLAALGSMVAGIAHELNTPIGNGLTVATTLVARTQDFNKALAAGLKRSTLDAFVADTSVATDILVRSLGKAATLVASFKQVAVDQASSQRRTFGLRDCLSEIILTLGPSLKGTGCKVVLGEVAHTLELDSYPGPLGQVITNLIQNSVLHGYDDRASGEIRVLVTAEDKDQVKIEVVDDGVGISSANLSRIFEPFFTTRLGKGGSGLGLSIVRNIVTGTLGGKISVNSTLGQGTVFSVTVPRVAPAVVASGAQHYPEPEA